MYYFHYTNIVLAPRFPSGRGVVRRFIARVAPDFLSSWSGEIRMRRKSADDGTACACTYCRTVVPVELYHRIKSACSRNTRFAAFNGNCSWSSNIFYVSIPLRLLVRSTSLFLFPFFFLLLLLPSSRCLFFRVVSRDRSFV